MYFQRHIFFCTNEKKDGGGCHLFGSNKAFIFAKEYLQEKKIWGEGLFRASKSGCLGRCDLGHVCVIYPEGVWYSYVDVSDVEQIIEEHLVNGRVVARLQLK